MSDCQRTTPVQGCTTIRRFKGIVTPDQSMFITGLWTALMLYVSHGGEPSVQCQEVVMLTGDNANQQLVRGEGMRQVHACK